MAFGLPVGGVLSPAVWGGFLVVGGIFGVIVLSLSMFLLQFCGICVCILVFYCERDMDCLLFLLFFVAISVGLV